MFNDVPWFRIGLPSMIAVVGVIIGFSGSGITETIGFVLVGVAVIVLGADMLYVISVRDTKKRKAEERARKKFKRTGHWTNSESG